MKDRSPTLRLHLSLFLPVFGLALPLLARCKGPSDEAREAELLAALRWQLAAAGVIALHLAIHGAILATGWMVDQAGTDELVPLMKQALSALVWINLFAGLSEWGFFALWAVLASRGSNYPLGDPRVAPAPANRRKKKGS